MNGTQTATKPTALRGRVVGGGTPVMKKWNLTNDFGVLKDVLLGPAEGFRWMGLENAAWSALVRDGNKRVSLVVCRTFLLLNGYDLVASQQEKYETFLRLAAGDVTEDELADWIRARWVEVKP